MDEREPGAKPEPAAADGAADTAAADRLALARRYRALAPRLPEGGLDLVEVFAPKREIEIEIGFGRGMFLLQRAAAAPGSALLGIEIKDKLAVRVNERVARLGPTSSVRVLAGDVRTILPQLRPSGCVARVFMCFPDPWWKKRHQRRRLLAAPLLDELARLLRPGGELFLQTDVEDRAEGFLEALRAHPAFEITGDTYHPENPYGARSNREARAIEDGLPIFRVLALTRSEPAAPSTPAASATR
jgi:tRNA (guanine-N7-)-methyltransferase